MVGCYIGDYCYIRPERVHSVELEAADFQHIMVEVILCYLHCKTFTYVAG